MIIKNVEIFKINTMIEGINYLFQLESDIKDLVDEPIAISQGTGEIVYGVADNFKVEKDYIVCDIEIAEPLPTRFSNTIIPMIEVTQNPNSIYSVITKIERLYFSNDPHLFDELNNNLQSAKSHISNYVEVVNEPIYLQGHYHIDDQIRGYSNQAMTLN